MSASLVCGGSTRCCGLTSPDATIVTGSLGLSPRPMGRFSIASTTSSPSRTCPKTTCLVSGMLYDTVLTVTYVLAIKPRGLDGADEELGSVGVSSGVGHG